MKGQWPYRWQGINPLHGPKDFSTMMPSERLDLLRTLIHWSLTSSETIQTIIKNAYKQQRHQDDENQPLSVQPWGSDGDKRRYFLVQGLDDTAFRVYREGSRYTKNANWINAAGDIEELKTLANKLNDVDGSQAGRRLAGRMLNAVPTFEASEEKRKKREQRQAKRAAFSRPEPGFSLYEGRTRGKRLRYTYDDDDDMVFGGDSDATSTRRSTRNQTSARNTPFEAGPTYTASGRQINKPKTGEYGEPLLRSALENATDELAPEYEDGPTGTDLDSEPLPNGRATRAAGRSAMNGVNSRKRKHVIDDDEDDMDDMSEDEAGNGGEDGWDSDRNAEEDTEMPDADDEESEDEDEEPQSLVVKLKVSPKSAKNGSNTSDAENTGEDVDGDSIAVAPKKADHTDFDANLEHTHQPNHAVDHATAAGAEQNGDTTAHSSSLNGDPPAASAAPPAAPAPGHQLSTPPKADADYPTPASTSFPATDGKPAPLAPITTGAEPVTTAPPLERTRMAEA